MADFDEPTTAFDMRSISIAASLDGHHQHAFDDSLDAQLCLLCHLAADVVDALHDRVLDGVNHVDEGKCATNI